MEEATEVLCKLPNLRELWLTIDRSGSLPTLVLPNLTATRVTYDHDHGWLQGIRAATLGKLTSVAFYSDYDPPTIASKRLKALRSPHPSR